MKDASIQKQLDENSVDQIKYASITVPLIGNVFTTCVLLANESNIISRGVSICSLLDCNDSKFAKRKSFSRAMKALVHKNESFPIQRHLVVNNKDEIIQKVFKVNMLNEEQVEKFQEFLRIVQITMNRDIIVKQVPYGSWEDNKHKVKMFCDIPKWFPVAYTSKFYSHKSTWKPSQIYNFEVPLSHE